jgi:hypothetical protein
MSHDKISAAARRRMAATGESYAAARRAVISEHQAARARSAPPGSQWFAISYSDAWEGRLTAGLDHLLFRAGPGVSGAEVDPGQIRVRMADFQLDIPRASVRAVRRSSARVGGTAGVHGGRGRWLVNGSPDGLVEIAIDPPVRTGRSLSTLFFRERVTLLIMSLVDPDGFITATALT